MDADAAIAIGAEGGTIVSNNGSKIIIPEDALTDKILLQVNQLESASLYKQLPAGTEFIGGLRISPSGIVFNKPITVKIKIDDVSKIKTTVVPIWTYESDEGKYRYDGWVGTVDESGFITCNTIQHFSDIFGINFDSNEQIKYKNHFNIVMENLIKYRNEVCSFRKGFFSFGDPNKIKNYIDKDYLYLLGLRIAISQVIDCDAIACYDPLTNTININGDSAQYNSICYDSFGNLSNECAEDFYHELIHYILDVESEKFLLIGYPLYFNVGREENITWYMDGPVSSKEPMVALENNLKNTDCNYGKYIEQLNNYIGPENSPATQSLSEYIANPYNGEPIPINVLDKLNELFGFYANPVVMKAGYEALSCGDCLNNMSEILTDKEKSNLSSIEINELNVLSGDELNEKGISILQTGNILKSGVYFKLSAYKFNGVSSSESDKANFFRALTRVATIVFDNKPDGIADGYKDFGDILDGFGYSQTDRDFLTSSKLNIPQIMPSNSPRPIDIITFIDVIARPELLGAIEDLKTISQSFNVLWNEPQRGALVESDYGDVLFIRAALLASLGQIDLEKSYDLECDIDTEWNNKNNTYENFLKNYANFLRLTSTEKLSSAKSFAKDAAKAALDAINWILNESDNQTNDFINLSRATLEEINNYKKYLSSTITSLEGGLFVYDNKTPNDSSDDSTLALQNFFNGIDIRSLLPAFAGNEPKGFFPDPSFKGMLIKFKGQNAISINADNDGNGNADIFDHAPGNLGGQFIGFINANFLYWKKVENATQYRIYYATHSGVSKADTSSSVFRNRKLLSLQCS